MYVLICGVVTDKYGERDPDDEINKAFQVFIILSRIACI